MQLVPGNTRYRKYTLIIFGTKMAKTIDLCKVHSSAFYAVVRWHKLGEVENECTSHNFIVLAIFLPKIIKVGGNLTEF